MSGYDGPSYYKNHATGEKRPSLWENRKEAENEKEKKYALPNFSTKQEEVVSKRTSTPFRIHTVPSSYFRTKKTETSKRTDYRFLRGKLEKKETDFLLFEAFLSEKAEKLFVVKEETEQKMISKNSRNIRLNSSLQKKSNGHAARKRLSRSLAGIIEAEKTNENLTRNMNSLFSKRNDL